MEGCKRRCVHDVNHAHTQLPKGDPDGGRKLSCIDTAPLEQARAARSGAPIASDMSWRVDAIEHAVPPLHKLQLGAKEPAVHR